MKFVVIFVLLVGALFPNSGLTREIEVNAKVVPPYAYLKDGQWVGTHIEIFENVLENLGHLPRYHNVTLNGLTSGVEYGDVEVSVAAITATSDRLKIANTSLPLSVGYLGIASKNQAISLTEAVFKMLLSLRLWGPIGIFLLICTLVGEIISYFEVRGGNESFRGVWSSIWFSVVTTTTTGYGDLAPQTKIGRFVAMLFMLSSAFYFAAFTGAISANLTDILNSNSSVTESMIRTSNRTIGVLDNAFAEDYMKKTDATVISYKSLDEGLKAVKNDEIFAFVHDREVLKWELAHDDSLTISEDKFAEQYYVVLFAKSSKLLESFNIALLQEQGK